MAVVRLARVSCCLIELFAGAFLFLDRRLARRHFCIVALGVSLVTDAARFLKLEPIELILGERNSANLYIKPAANPLDRAKAHFEIAVFDLGVKSVPEIREQAADEVDTLSQAGDFLLH